MPVHQGLPILDSLFKKPAEPAPTVHTAEPEVRRAVPVETNTGNAAAAMNHWADTPPAAATVAPVVAAPSVAPVVAPSTVAPAVAPTTAAPAVAPAADSTSAPAAVAPATPGQEHEPPRLDRKLVNTTLHNGSKGTQVEALQHYLGLEGKAADGAYGPGTAAKVKEYQVANGLPPTGYADAHTIAAMRGDPYIFGYNLNQDPNKFVPKYAMTAYHESNDMRNAVDPYATGAITHPDKKSDPGGKTYGTYQFESYTYRDGSDAGQKQVNGSTVSRFANWEGNPYEKQFQEVIAKHGVASPEFDALWSQLSTGQNKSFGMAQEHFLEHDKAAQVNAVLDKIGASPEARQDPRLFDLMIGTTNQLGGLAGGIATDVSAEQKANGKPFTADQIGRAVIDDKTAHVDKYFGSSKQATRDAVRERYADERTVFADKKLDPHAASS